MFLTKGWKDRIESIDARSRESFAKVKADVQKLNKWVQHLNQVNLAQQREIKRLHVLQQHAVTRESVAALVRDSIPDTSTKERESAQRMGRIEDRLLRVEELLRERPALRPAEKVSAPSPQTNLQKKIVNSVGRQSKEYIKRTIVSICQKYDHITATELRETVVDEQKLCSRSSFYRLLDELTSEGKIRVVSSGKERTLAANRKLFKH